MCPPDAVMVCVRYFQFHHVLFPLSGWHLATKSLLATSAECYEREWEGRDNFQQAGEVCACACACVHDGLVW